MRKEIKYHRVMLKISGEALSGGNGLGIDLNVIKFLAAEIVKLKDLKIELGIIIGGGNLFRGANLQKIERVSADQMGMLATVINSLAMRDIFEKVAVSTEIMSAIAMPNVVEIFDRRKAEFYFQQGRVVIFVGGTGNPLVTTDTALALRGIELHADILLKATNVDGIYSADPKIDPRATLYHSVTYDEALAKNLKVMDLAAFTLCREHRMLLKVFNIQKSGALLKIIQGEAEGTSVVI